MSLLSLPPEILELIFTHSSLSFQDIYRLSLTCRRLYCLVNGSWNIIANTRWTWWSECNGISNEEWHSLCKQRYLCETKMNTAFETVIKKGVRLYLTDEEELEIFEELIIGETTKVCTHQLMEWVLKEILTKSVSEANLSHQYYGLSLYEYLKRQKLRKQLKDLLGRPSKEQLLIKAAILIRQWINPLNCPTQEDITQHIVMIATEVAKDLLKVSNDDSSCSTPLPLPPQCMFDRVKQSTIPCLDILKAINRVMFIQLGFKPARDNYYLLSSSLIDQVLVKRQGIPITLSAIYQAIADTLGVTLLPVNFPAHFLLKAPQNLITGEGEVFVDAYGRGQLLSQEDCLALVPFLTVPQPDMFNPVDPYKAMIRMVANIYSRGHHHSLGLNFDVGRQWNEEKQQWGPIVLPSALALQLTLCWISPVSDFTRQVAADAANIALDLRFNVKQVVWVMSDMLVQGNSLHVLTKLQRAQTQSEKRKKVLAEPTRVKHRDMNKVAFTIGDVMKHLRYNYRCVIYGWDLRCEMSPAWIEQMGVHHLSLGPDQPFYNVLVEDGTNRYAAQESLFPCPLQELGPIRHWEVGKYFQAYKGDRYIPNNALSEKYPPTNS